MARCGPTRWKACGRSGSAPAAARNLRGSGGSDRRPPQRYLRWRSVRVAAPTPTSPSSGCHPRPGARRWTCPRETLSEKPSAKLRGGAGRLLDVRRRDVPPALGRFAFHLELQHARLADAAAVHLALVLRAPVEQDPSRVERIRVADERDGRAWTLPSDSSDDTQHALAHRLDGLVAGQEPTLRLVHEPQRTPDRDLPVRNPLQVAREPGLTKLGVRLERRARRQLVG